MASVLHPNFPVGTHCEPDDPEPRGLAIVIVGATAAMQFVLPSSLAMISPYTLFALIGFFLAGAIWSHRVQKYTLNTIFGYAMTITLTAFMLMSFIFSSRDCRRTKRRPNNS